MMDGLCCAIVVLRERSVDEREGSVRLSCLLAQLHCMSHVLAFILLPSLAAGLAVRYQPRVVRSPAAHTPGVRSVVGKGMRTNSWTKSVRLGGVGRINWTFF